MPEQTQILHDPTPADVLFQIIVTFIWLHPTLILLILLSDIFISFVTVPLSIGTTINISAPIAVVLSICYTIGKLFTTDWSATH